MIPDGPIPAVRRPGVGTACLPPGGAGAGREVMAEGKSGGWEGVIYRPKDVPIQGSVPPCYHGSREAWRKKVLRGFTSRGGLSG